jgi:hypothetical protein
MNVWLDGLIEPASLFGFVGSFLASFLPSFLPSLLPSFLPLL